MVKAQTSLPFARQAAELLWGASAVQQTHGSPLSTVLIRQTLASGRQVQMKGCAAPRVADCPQAPTMRLDD